MFLLCYYLPHSQFYLRSNLEHYQSLIIKICTSLSAYFVWPIWISFIFYVNHSESVSRGFKHQKILIRVLELTREHKNFAIIFRLTYENYRWIVHDNWHHLHHLTSDASILIKLNDWAVTNDTVSSLYKDQVLSLIDSNDILTPYLVLINIRDF